MLPGPAHSLRALASTRNPIARFTAAVLTLLLFPAAARAGKINPSPDVKEALRRMYSGDTNGAIEIAHRVERQQPQHPLGYLLEVNALWWKIYCAVCAVKWNLIDAWDRKKLREDDAYLALADRAIALAEAELKSHETAEMHVYAGAAYGLKARLYALRGEHLNVARSGLRGRTHFVRALELDPEMGDAYTGMGLYNYFVDALSTFAKMLRFFMGIPGGSKKTGFQQLEKAMDSAELSAVEARFYLARNLRNFDQLYERSRTVFEPLVAEYPQNPVFALLLGDINAKLNRKEKAAASFRAAQKMVIGDSACAARVAELTRNALAALGAPGSAASAGAPGGP
jgi:tetratricopeptide (TPR) repeat protein